MTDEVTPQTSHRTVRTNEPLGMAKFAADPLQHAAGPYESTGRKVLKLIEYIYIYMCVCVCACLSLSCLYYVYLFFLNPVPKR